MMKFVETNITDEICHLRMELYGRLTSPIDAMWEQLYIDSSQHYFIKVDNKVIGYCCIEDGANLLQAFLKAGHLSQADQLIMSLIGSKLISGSKLSSSEPVIFNACLRHAKAINENTLCFEHSNKALKCSSDLNLELLPEEDIPELKSFLKEQVGFDDTFGYTENLVSRGEIFSVKECDAIIATSECRMSDSQPEFADLGIIVDKDYQGRGIATQVMQIQVKKVLEENRFPICSTTVENLASVKAIERSGFYCSNIIFDMSFV